MLNTAKRGSGGLKMSKVMPWFGWVRRAVQMHVRLDLLRILRRHYVCTCRHHEFDGHLGEVANDVARQP